MIALFNEEVSNELFNVGTGIETSVNELKELIFQKMEKEVPVEYLPMDQHLVKRRQCSTRKIFEKLGFTPEVPLDEGVDRYLRALIGEAVHA